MTLTSNNADNAADTKAVDLSRVTIGIGANLGNAQETVEQTIQLLCKKNEFNDAAFSSIYKSAPIDSSGPDYFNAVLTADTTLSAPQVLSLLQNIERDAGRERPYKNAPRSLDLDLLLYDTLQMDSPILTLPHPRMHLRAFVLMPLAEIAPDAIIPGIGPVSELLDSVADQSVVAVA